MSRRILIIEDEPAFAEVIQELLAEEGYSVVHVRDAITALKLLTRNDLRPDAILCDVMLPGLRGDRFALEVRRRFPLRRLPILLLSASSDPDSRLRDVSFMAKPFETSELLSHIKAILADGPAIGSPEAAAS